MRSSGLRYVGKVKMVVSSKGVGSFEVEAEVFFDPVTNRYLLVRPVLCFETCHGICCDEEDFDDCMKDCMSTSCSSPSEEVDEEEEWLEPEEFEELKKVIEK